MLNVWIYLTFSEFPELFKKQIGVKMGSTQIETHSNFARKVRKTPDFLSKSGVFMVAEAGLEPTTSGL